MAVIADASRDVLDRIAVIENNGESLSGLHRFQLQFRLDKIVGTNNPAQIQFRIGPHTVMVLFALFHVHAHGHRIQRYCIIRTDRF